ncbi:hypothetical protein [Salinarimonas sp.]|uniref:hypothetical protein n=1 Tax=Salinarimonas sp. TaxID=2766526 RepID=UPI0032D987D0
MGAADVVAAAGREARDLARVMRRDPVAGTGARLLLGITLGAVLVHCAAIAGEQLGLLRDEALVDFLRLDYDRALPEILNYGQTLLAAVLFGILFLRGRGAVFAGFALAFAVIALDDMVSYHEMAGDALVVALDLPALPGLRPDDSGELLAWALVGVPLVALLAWGFVVADRAARGLAVLAGASLGLLAVFAVGVDMAHVALTSEAVGLPAALAGALGIAPDLAFKGVDAVLMTAEDGGEMLAIALAAALALAAWRRETAASDRHFGLALAPERLAYVQRVGIGVSPR